MGLMDDMKDDLERLEGLFNRHRDAVESRADHNVQNLEAEIRGSMKGTMANVVKQLDYMGEQIAAMQAKLSMPQASASPADAHQTVEANTTAASSGQSEAQQAATGQTGEGA